MKLYQYVSHFFLKKLNISNCLDFFLGAAFTSTRFTKPGQFEWDDIISIIYLHFVGIFLQITPPSKLKKTFEGGVIWSEYPWYRIFPKSLGGSTPIDIFKNFHPIDLKIFLENFNGFVVQKKIFRPRRIFWVRRIFYQVQLFWKTPFLPYFGNFHQFSTHKIVILAWKMTKKSLFGI